MILSAILALFLYHQNTFDIESLLPGIFGNIDKIVLGYGSEQGFRAVKIPELANLPKELQELIKVLSTDILKVLSSPEQVSNDELAVMGYARRLVRSGDSLALETDSKGRNIVRDKLTGTVELFASLVIAFFCCFKQAMY